MCNENTWNIVSGPVWVMLPSWTFVPNASSLRFCWVKCFDPKSSCEFVLFFFANNPWNQTDLYLFYTWENEVCLLESTEKGDGAIRRFNEQRSVLEVLLIKVLLALRSRRVVILRIVWIMRKSSRLHAALPHYTAWFMHFHADFSIFDILTVCFNSFKLKIIVWHIR